MNLTICVRYAIIWHQIRSLDETWIIYTHFCAKNAIEKVDRLARASNCWYSHCNWIFIKLIKTVKIKHASLSTKLVTHVALFRVGMTPTMEKNVVIRGVLKIIYEIHYTVVLMTSWWWNWHESKAAPWYNESIDAKPNVSPKTAKYATITIIFRIKWIYPKQTLYNPPLYFFTMTY